jgi:hypothetical protein
MTPDSLAPMINPLLEIFLRLAINIAVLFIIIYLIFFRYAKKKDQVFPFFLMGVMIFLICILLKKTEMNMGMALGLFAIFSIVRFRTENLVTKNMAYLFTVIGVSVINAMFDFPHPVRGTILVNLIIIVTVFLLEIAFSKFSADTSTKEEIKAEKKAKKEAEKEAEKNTEKNAAKKAEKEKSTGKHRVIYDNLQLLNPAMKDELLKDITSRTGIKIDKVKIVKIDLISVNAVLDVYYKKKSDESEV